METINGAHIAIGIEPSSMESFIKLQELVQAKAQEKIDTKTIKATKSPHITVDFLWQSTLEIWKERMQHTIKRSKLGEGLKDIQLGTIKSFTSNKEKNKYIVYIEIIGWESFFQSLRDDWYSIQIPHITLCEINDTSHPEEAISSILQWLNEDKDIANYMREILINTNVIELRYKDTINQTAQKIVNAIS